MWNRRHFLRGTALAGSAFCTTSSAAPYFLLDLGRRLRPATDRRVLVVVQLDGGNDALNTVVPFGDDGYARSRNVLRLASDEVLRLDDHVGLHPALEPLMDLLGGGRLSVVQNVGYPNPSRSHFRSMATWHAARLDPEEHGGVGWLGRALDELHAGGRRASALSIGPGAPPVAVRGSRASAASLERLEDFAFLPGADPRTTGSGASAKEDLEAYVRRAAVQAGEAADRIASLRSIERSRAAYPENALGRRLRLVATLLQADHGARVFYTQQTGYDTHARQLPAHENLLTAFAESVRAFFADLDASGLSDRVLLLAFSEFGRTLVENASEGTDHGTQGAVFVAGPTVRRPLIGPAPDLEDLVDGEPLAGLDFRSIYATVRSEWLGLGPEGRASDRYEPLALLGSD